MDLCKHHRLSGFKHFWKIFTRGCQNKQGMQWTHLSYPQSLRLLPDEICIISVLSLSSHTLRVTIWNYAFRDLRMFWWQFLNVKVQKPKHVQNTSQAKFSALVVKFCQHTTGNNQAEMMSISPNEQGYHSEQSRHTIKKSKLILQFKRKIKANLRCLPNIPRLF